MGLIPISGMVCHFGVLASTTLCPGSRSAPRQRHLAAPILAEGQDEEAGGEKAQQTEVMSYSHFCWS